MTQNLIPPADEAMSEVEIRHRAMRREIALINERTELDAAWQRGLEEGLKEGLKEGLEKAMNHLIASGIPEAEARAWLDM